MSCCPKFRAGPNVINLAKFSDEEPVIQIDWSQRPLASTDEIQSSVWEVRPSGSPMSAISQGFAGQITSVRLTGGEEQHVYLLLNTVTIIDVYGSTQVLTQELQVYIQDQSAPSPPPPCPPPPGAVMDVVSLSPQIVTERDGDIVTVTYAGITDVIAGNSSISAAENDGVVSVSLVEFPDAPSDVYVDSVSGSDAQDGLTPAAAVATIARAREIVGPYVGSTCTVHLAANPDPSPLYVLADLIGTGTAPRIQAPARLVIAGTDLSEIVPPQAVVSGTQIAATLGGTWTTDELGGHQVEVVSASNAALVGLRRTVLENVGSVWHLSVPLPTALQPGDVVRVVTPSARVQGGVVGMAGNGALLTFSGLEISGLRVEGAATLLGSVLMQGVVFDSPIRIESTFLYTGSIVGATNPLFNGLGCSSLNASSVAVASNESGISSSGGLTMNWVTLGAISFSNMGCLWTGRAASVGMFYSPPGCFVGSTGNIYSTRARSIVGNGGSGAAVNIAGCQAVSLGRLEVRTSGSANGVLLDLWSMARLQDTAAFPLVTQALRAQDGSRVTRNAGAGLQVANWYLGRAGNPNTVTVTPVANTAYSNSLDFSSLTSY